MFGSTYDNCLESNGNAKNCERLEKDVLEHMRLLELMKKIRERPDDYFYELYIDIRRLEAHYGKYE